MKVKILNDGNIFSGRDACEVVQVMKNSSLHLKDLSLEEYMLEVKEWCDDEKINTSSCEAFIVSLEEAGYLAVV